MGPRELGLFSMHQPHTSYSLFSPTSIFDVYKLWKVTHGGTSYFFTLSTGFLTFYESWTVAIACIHVFYTLGNIYIEAFSFLVAIFVILLLSLAHFRLLPILSFQHQFEVI